MTHKMTDDGKRVKLSTCKKLYGAVEQYLHGEVGLESSQVFESLMDTVGDCTKQSALFSAPLGLYLRTLEDGLKWLFFLYKITESDEYKFGSRLKLEHAFAELAKVYDTSALVTLEDLDESDDEE
jgi:hypothetical protein